MAVGVKAPENILPVPGIRLASVEAGIRYKNRNDMVLVEIAEGATVSGTFTKNAFCAAPVIVAKEHQAKAPCRYWLINAGNANAGTGEQGLADARLSCEWLANACSVSASNVWPFSTGVIGQNLPMTVIEKAIPRLVEKLAEDGWMEAARSIMTTDTVVKIVTEQVQLKGKAITITGMAKGSGMICPNMATMLAYAATDLAVEQDVLDGLLKTAVDLSFNSITVDGDTSTNDACVLAATGQSGVHFAALDDAEQASFVAALNRVMLQLAQLVVRDGEGATKLIAINVDGAVSVDEAREVGYTVAHSPLVKTALFASDANWGRILAAVGRARVDNLDVNAITIHLDDVCIVANGGRHPDYTEEMGSAVMKQEEISININLGRGDRRAVIWTTDLSFEYVKINAEYRS